MRDRLKHFFENRGITKIETSTAKFSLVNNGGKLPVIVDDVDLFQIPAKFKRIKTEIDKTAIAEALAAQEDLPFARFGERGKSLRIK